MEGKLKTPDWIIEGYDSPIEYEKAKGKQKAEPLVSSSKSQTKGKVKYTKKKSEGKVFKIRECPKCGSDNVRIALSNLDSEEESNTGKEWECQKCKWIGKNVLERELTEDEFMKYLDEKGEETA